MISGVWNNEILQNSKNKPSLICSPYLMALSIGFLTERKRGWQVVLIQIIIVVLVVTTRIKKKKSETKGEKTGGIVVATDIFDYTIFFCLFVSWSTSAMFAAACMVTHYLSARGKGGEK